MAALAFTFAVGCGGNATISGSGRADGNATLGGGPGAESIGDAAALGGAPGTGSMQEPGVAGSGGLGECTRSLEEAASTWALYPGDVCPPSRCAALVMAASCEALPTGTLTSSQSTCGSVLGITLNLSEGRGRTCYYEGDSLSGAEAWGGTGALCGSANRIEGGAVPTGCEAATQVCGTERQGDRFGPGTPFSDATCASLSSNSCGEQRCCPDVPPDCAGKPDGYPESCTPRTSRFCRCACYSEEWLCLC